MEFETLYQDLAYGAEIIQALVMGVTQAEAQVRPTPESWSILEVIGHLVDEEREDFRQRVDFILNRPGEEWPPIHPGAWVTERKYNERDLEQSLNDFLAERSKSLAFLRGLDSADWNASHMTEFGERKAGQLLGSWVAHDNLHMRQLVELRRAKVEKISGPYDILYAGDW
ncbi:MAG: DinB family protein [Burkholderiales bacterium]|nr:DinB family protein [Anaerolineae bacterium]